MNVPSHNSARFALALCLLWGLCVSPSTAQLSNAPDIPDNFTWDIETAARLHPLLYLQSFEASGRFSTGQRVFETLIVETHPPAHLKPAWALRIANESQLNAFSSPDGAIFVERDLAQLAGTNSGLWAAILSHEIAHVLRRDWARRYLYEKALERGGTAVSLGDPGLSGSWIDERKASEELAAFCRQLELEADAESLMLMAHAGYHPDFVPALHHLLEAQAPGPALLSPNAMHPRWATRDRDLELAYASARLEFDRRWPAWYASPGGNPPIVVFAGQPSVHTNHSHQREILVPMRCQNLVGAVEVILRPRPPLRFKIADTPELRQVTGCTSYKTLVSFPVPEDFHQSDLRKSGADVYVLDDFGSILARASLAGSR